jgi:hypothetical protein
VLLTRSPLSPGPKARFSLDLHVLSAPPAFVLSQDQTLREDWFAPKGNLLFELVLKGHVQIEPGRDGILSLRPASRSKPSGVSTYHAVEFSKTAPLASAA